MTKPAVSVSSQMGRVIAVMCDGKLRTLRDIERECRRRFGHADTQSGISARLRQVACKGWIKHAYRQQIGGKQVWHYRIELAKTGDAA